MSATNRPTPDKTDSTVTDLGPILLIGAIALLPAATNTIVDSRLIVLSVAAAIVTLLVPILTKGSWRTITRRPFDPAAPAAAALAAFLLAAFAFHPSGTGAILVFYAFLGAGLAATVGGLRGAHLRRWVALPLLATTSLQALLVAAQSATDRAIGLDIIDPAAHLHVIDGLIRPEGTMHHVYEPAALALVAVAVALVAIPATGDRAGWWWSAGLFLSGLTIGLTHSRAALLGLILLLGFVFAARRRGVPGAAMIGGAVLIGFIVGAAFTWSSWALRFGDTAVTNLDDASLGRITLARQAVTMIGDNPLVGVGPGNYLAVMRTDYGLDERYPFVVHDVPLMLAAEAGVMAAVIIVTAVGWAMLRAGRRGPLQAAAALAPVGFLLFDVVYYDRPVGLLMLGVWLGALSAANRAPHPGG